MTWDLDNAGPRKVIWCAGVYASGSTWLFNVSRDIAWAVMPDIAIQSGFVNTIADVRGLLDPRCNCIIKTHNVAAEVEKALLEAADAVLVTVRDPRDAVTSLMRYQRFPFDMALDWVARSTAFCARISTEGRARLLRYEDGMTGDPATLITVAAALGVTLDAGTRSAIFERHRRQEVERRIAEMARDPAVHHDPRSGDYFHPATQWHRHHAGRDGQMGRWLSMLLPTQVVAVQRALSEEMRHFGYEAATPSWSGLGGVDPFVLKN